MPKPAQKTQAQESTERQRRAAYRRARRRAAERQLNITIPAALDRRVRRATGDGGVTAFVRTALERAVDKGWDGARARDARLVVVEPACTPDQCDITSLSDGSRSGWALTFDLRADDGAISVVLHRPGDDARHEASASIRLTPNQAALLRGKLSPPAPAAADPSRRSDRGLHRS